MEDILKKIKVLFSDDKKIKVVVFIGLLGMALILFSSFFSGKEDKSTKSTAAETEKSAEYDNEIEEYTKSSEEKLKVLLGNIKGVGRVEVMLNVSSTKEYVYADEEKSNKSEDGENHSEQKENNYFIIENDGEREALLKKINSPEISGIVIVCEGGDSNVVRESIYKSVSVAFELPTSKIYVAKIK